MTQSNTLRDKKVLYLKREVSTSDTGVESDRAKGVDSASKLANQWLNIIENLSTLGRITDSWGESVLVALGWKAVT